MDENSRVKNIKQRFEDFNASNQFTAGNIFHDFEALKSNVEYPNESSIRTHELSNDKFSVSHRANIKRTPAFRRDKILNRNADKGNDHEEQKTSIVTNRVNHFNQLKKEDNGKRQESAKSNTSKNKSNSNRMAAVNNFDADLLKGNAYQFNDLKNSDSGSEIANTYAKIKKPLKNNKPVIKNRKSTEDHDQMTESRRSLKGKLGFEGNKKVENSLNKENKCSSSNQKWSDKINEDLSDTLKRVLRSPLPPGPPPKKPPRTFTAKPVNNTVENKFSSNLENAINCENLPLIPDARKPVRSKTESEIMLRKIEIALFKHQENASPKTFRKVSAPESKLEKYTEFNKCRRRLSDKIHGTELTKSKSTNDAHSISEPFVTTCSDTGCFPWLGNRLQNESVYNHIYEDPKQLSSSCPSPSEGILTNSLYYMSTPIDLIVNPNDKTTTEDLVEAQNLNIKTTSDICFRDDLFKVPSDISIENKIKIWMNNAYSKPWTKTSDGSSDSDSIMSVNMDDAAGQSKADVSGEEYDQVTLRRKGYVQKVASRVISRRQSVLVSYSSDYKHLFECLFLLGLDLDSRNNKVPYVKMKYPCEIQLPQWIEHMCFPDAHDWSNTASERLTNEKNSTAENRNYVITLTTQAGQRKYVYCRRLKPEGESASLPLSYCLLSPHQSYEFYFLILEELENRHGQSEIQFQKFIKELYENKFPARGQGVKINSYSEDGREKIREEVIERPSDSRVEDLRLAKTLSYLKINIFLLLFSSMLLERKVILLSSCLSKLSTCMGGLQVALLPFQWQHTLITVVPSNLISVSDLCEAPTPYLIGLLKPKNSGTSILQNFGNKQQILAVDLDEKKVIRKVGDETSILPSHLTKGIKNALQLAHSSEACTNNLLACEAFTRLFVELIGHYRRYIFPHNNGSIQKKSFQKEAFVKAGSPHSVRMFLEWFVETAAFSTFIDMRLVNNVESKGLLEQRYDDYFNELNRLKYAKNKKIVKQIGDFIKDWTSTS